MFYSFILENNLTHIINAICIKYTRGALRSVRIHLTLNRGFAYILDDYPNGALLQVHHTCFTIFSLFQFCSLVSTNYQDIILSQQ